MSLDFEWLAAGEEVALQNFSANTRTVLVAIIPSHRALLQNFHHYHVHLTSGTAPLESLRCVFVITSPATASASEMVINGLRPLMPVITIGATTFGKPYAFQPRDACGITYSAVNLDIANKDGFSDYSAGFAPTCAVSDDLTRQLGDPAELRTAAALGYITTGACPAVAANLQENKALSQHNRAQAAIQSIANERRNALGFGEVPPPQLVLLP